MSTLPGMPFELELDEAMIADVRMRVENARFPREQAGEDWTTGTPLSYMHRLRRHWLDAFDWKHWVDRINAFDNRMVDVQGVQIHVLVEQGSGDNPVPLMMTPGWPGTFLEFIDVIDLLAHPERHGGRAEDAFTVIVPSLPGYGLSPAPIRPYSPLEIAALWSSLMVNAFRVDRYVAYGSDWGSLITANLAFDHPERLAGIMITTAGMSPDLSAGPELKPEEQEWLGQLQTALKTETGYQAIQATKPQTLAYAQTDSPIGLAAWIVEKYQGWTVPGSRDDPPFPLDALLANIMLYWRGGSLAPSWLYMYLDSAMTPRTGKAKVPATFMLPPEDLFLPVPRCWLERGYNVAGYVQAGRGHFPGQDSPGELVAELRRMLRPLGAA